jgi:hypothetical protein
MHRNFLKVAVLLIAVLYTLACSENPKSEQSSNQSANAPAGPPAPVSGKTAFWAMYKSAYSWSSDAAPLKLESENVSGVRNEAGTAGMWRATFGSARREEAIEISYAVAPQPPDIIKGVNVGHPVFWAGPTRDVMPFQGSDIVTDSDVAYKTAVSQAESWLKKNSDKQASFLLGNNPTTFARPVWFVQWGDKKSGYRVFVDSKTGQVAKPVK